MIDLESLNNWSDMLVDRDVITLLQAIWAVMYQQIANQAPVHSLINVEMNLYKFRQMENMSNAVYLEKLKGLIEVYEHASSEPGMSQQCIAHFMNLD
jgi:hypothetical protein